MTDDNAGFLFQATTFSLSHISNILGAIQQISSKVLVTIDEDGLNFITENFHICRVELTLEKSLFTTYDYNKGYRGDTADGDNGDDSDDGITRFAIDLKPIVESLSLAHKNEVSNAQCTIFYESSGSPFILIFEDSKMIERCEFSTFINLDLEANNLGFEINQDEILMEGLIKADVLHDVLKDLKDLNTDEIFIYGSTTNPKVNKFAIISKSEMGNSILYLPNERSILEKLVINKESGVDISCFKFSIFNLIIRAIRLSNKCKFKRDESILSLNLLSLFGSDLPKNYTGTVIDFKILQLVDKEDQIEEFINSLEEKQTKAPVNNNQNGGGNLVDLTQEDHEEDEEGEDHNAIEVPIFL